MSQNIAKLFDNYNKIIIEIGSGDGRLLNNLANFYDKNKVLFIGIEIDRSQYNNSCNRIDRKENKKLRFINEPFEKAFENFYDNSIDTVISVLPHPTYIDKINQKTWIPIYKTILNKIKVCGYFILVTELIDDLLEPVSVSDYTLWKKWLIETLSFIGFKILRIIEGGAPLCFSSHYLDKFMNDPERIKIISLIMIKK
jgi:phospholipid N-methyltransferase